MPDTKAISNRIKSVRDTRKITNAMYLISSTKLRKARKSLDDTNPFFHKLREEIGNIVDRRLVYKSRYLLAEDEIEDSIGTCGILVITADKGLAGTYNQNVIKKTLSLMEEYPDHRLFVVGEYGKHYFSSHQIPFDENFEFSDVEPTLYQARMIAGYIMDSFDRKELARIHIIYTDFKNALASQAIDLRLLPFEKEYFLEYSKGEAMEEFEYVPSPQDVLEHCIPVYCIGLIYSILVYSYCCEQNDRMMAMDSANKNADSLIADLTLRYNHLRQNSITQEITEISASVKARQANGKESTQ